MEAYLKQWIEKTLNGKVTSSRRQGRGREAWFIDVVNNEGETIKCYLRCGRHGKGAVGKTFNLERETTILKALEKTGVPVPRVYGYNEQKPAVLMSSVPGRPDFHHLPAGEEKESIADEFMSHIAALHQCKPDSLGLKFVPMLKETESLALHDLMIWEEDFYSANKQPDAALVFALQWLHRNEPANRTKFCLIQGDTGPGQFLFHEGKVSAIVDWEFAHWGDPMEDLAMIRARDLVTPFGDLCHRFKHYSQESGHALDLLALRYYSVRAMINTPLALAAFVQNPHPLADTAEFLSWYLLYKRATIEVLAEAMAVELTEPEYPAAQKTPRSKVFDIVETNLEDEHKPTIQDSYQEYRMGGTIRLLKYLQRADLHGAQIDRIELSEINSLLGHQYSTLEDANVALLDLVKANDESQDELLVKYFYRRAVREEFLLKPAMGEMEHSVIAPIE